MKESTRQKIEDNVMGKWMLVVDARDACRGRDSAEEIPSVDTYYVKITHRMPKFMRKKLLKRRNWHDIDLNYPVANYFRSNVHDSLIAWSDDDHKLYARGKKAEAYFDSILQPSALLKLPCAHAVDFYVSLVIAPEN